MNRIGKVVATTVFATGVLGGVAVLAQDQGEKAAPGQTPMMDSDQMHGMQRDGMGGMMGMMGMMSAMTDMMQTCNQVMQAMLPATKPPAEPEKGG